MANQIPASEKAHSDLESGNLNLLDSEGGASLRRQISVQLTAEQFERLYLQPGGVKAKGDLAKVGRTSARDVLAFVAPLTALLRSALRKPDQSRPRVLCPESHAVQLLPHGVRSLPSRARRDLPLIRLHLQMDRDLDRRGSHPRRRHVLRRRSGYNPGWHL